MEECLVLNLRYTWVLQMLHIHEASWLFHLCSLHSFIGTVGIGRGRSHRMSSTTLLANLMLFHRWEVIVLTHSRTDSASLWKLIWRVVDCVFTSQRIKLALHQEVKEVTGGCVVSHVTVEVNCPEERVRLGGCGVWEGDKVKCDMSNYSFVVQDLSNRVTYCLHIHVWQGLLREEATWVDELFRCKSIDWADQRYLTIWFNDEWNRWTSHLIWQASWHCLNYSTHSAEVLQVLIPGVV